MDTLKTFLPLSQWDVEWQWTQVDILLRKGLNQLMIDDERQKGIENIILAMHVFDNLPTEGFMLAGTDKTLHLLMFVPSILQGEARDIALRFSDRLLELPAFHQDCEDLGYFTYFLKLFYLFAQHRMGPADPLFSSLFRDSVEKYRALLRYPQLRLGLSSRTYELQKQLLWDDVIVARTQTSLNKAALFAEQLKSRLFLEIWYMKTVQPSYAEDWGKQDVDIDIPGSIGKAVEDYSLWIHNPSEKKKFLDSPIYSNAQLSIYMDTALCDSGPMPAVGISPSDIETICSFLPQDTAYLSSFQINDFLFVLAVKHDHAVTFFASQTLDPKNKSDNPLEFEYGRIVNIIRALSHEGIPIDHRSVTRGGGKIGSASNKLVIEALNQLYDLIFTESYKMPETQGSTVNLEDFLDDVHTIVFSPSFPIQGVPLSALHNGKNFLIQDFCIAFVPNMTWFTYKHKHPFVPENALILADPTGDLPDSFDEGQKVTDFLQGTQIVTDLKVGAEISSSWLVTAGSQYDLIHYAGHGNFTLNSSSYLQLADERFSIRDVLDSNWKPKFVFLNACRSGERQIHFVEETLSIATAMLAAGTRAVVSSLWPIEDQMAARFAREFYKGFLKGESAGKSYQQAMQALIEEKSHPADWAAYVLIGDPHFRIYGE